MNKNQKIIVGLIAVIIVCSIIFVGFGLSKRITVNEYLADKGSKTLAIESYFSTCSVSLSSTDDNMKVRIIIDGQTIYEQDNTKTVNFDHSMGLGNHAISIYLENPSLFGLGSSILISGVITLNMW